MVNRPECLLEIGGRQLKAIYSLLPVQPGLGISVSVLIYANTLYVTSTTDKALGDVGGFLLHHLNMQAILPIDLHPRESQDSRLTSRKSSIVISLPVSVEGGVPRLWKTRQIIKDVQKSSDPFVIYLASSALMSLVPSQYVRNVLTKATENTATLKFSWLKGPECLLEIGGRQLKAIYSLLPVQPGLGISETYSR
ncbi:uncharacterized protein LOC103518025 [Diaphorina citri]|uniref:Uncharacterized protein LOC103518025 n=1 Tax=Diaphorina citri TaxID=121845 RepID=A0A1S3DGA4_DIACI|nr:uncharacterized protein LOC103518025 [Diaphorina citri]